MDPGQIKGLGFSVPPESNLIHYPENSGRGNRLIPGNSRMSVPLVGP